MANKQIDELTYASTITDATSIPVNNNTATYEAQQLTVGKLGDFLGSRANAVHNLGDVYNNKSSLVIDNPGALPAWTGEYVTNANNVYPDLYTWLKTAHPELCVTRAAYDAAITADGECKYFVIDEEPGSIRFPKYNYTAPDYPWIYCFNAAVPQTTTQGAEYTASLISKVSKAGDTMTGQLVMANGSNGIKFQGTNDNSYYVNFSETNITILDKNNKGILLDGNTNSEPFYTDGSTTTSLIPTLPNWGSIGGNITSQTDLTNYINQLINGANLMKNVQTTAQYITVSAGNNQTITFNFPSNGWFIINSLSLRSKNSYIEIGGIRVANADNNNNQTTYPVGTMFPVATDMVIKCYSPSLSATGSSTTITGYLLKEVE